MSEAYVGEIRMFGGNYAPAGWQKCDGSLLSINTYQVLYSLLGTIYGGDGVTTFGIPDLQGRIPVGFGQGSGLTNRVIGEKFGAEMVTLVESQLPTHSHSFTASAADATLPVPTAALFGSQVDNDKIYTAATSGNTSTSLATATVQTSGSSAAHNNLMPSLGVTYIICLQGIYPSRN